MNERHIKIIELIVASCSLIATGFAAYSAYILYLIENNRDQIKAIDAISDWNKSLLLTPAAGKCIKFLTSTISSSTEFREFNKSYTLTVHNSKKKLAEDCLKPNDIKLLTTQEGNNTFNTQDKEKFSQLIGYYLNNYEIVALYWISINDKKAKQILCDNMYIKNDDLIREFKNIAKNTEWWEYRNLDKFINECKPTPTK
ncbi:MAG: hypothetical protein WBP16_06615 [Ferruginibacter sp.]